MKGGDAPIGQDREKCGGRKKWNTVSQTLLGRPLRESGEELQTEYQYGWKWHLSLAEASKNLNSRIVGPNLGYVCLSSL